MRGRATGINRYFISRGENDERRSRLNELKGGKKGPHSHRCSNGVPKCEKIGGGSSTRGIRKRRRGTSTRRGGASARGGAGPRGVPPKKKKRPSHTGKTKGNGGGGGGVSRRRASPRWKKKNYKKGTVAPKTKKGSTNRPQLDHSRKAHFFEKGGGGQGGELNKENY